MNWFKDTGGTSVGVAAAIGTFSIWGVAGVYYHAMSSVPAFEILAHRVFWTLLLVLVLLGLTGRLKDFTAAFSTPKAAFLSLVCGYLIGLNWSVYIWAVVNGHAVQAGMGYFIMPLVMLAMGWIFLKEKLRPGQILALLVVMAGVGNEIIAFGDVPWVALLLAVSFGAYSLVRRFSKAGPLPGMAAETAVTAPVAGAFLVWSAYSGNLAFLHGEPYLDVMMVSAGAVTMIPLLLYVIANARLSMGTLGLIQYMNPTLQVITAVFIMGEPFEEGKFVTFGLIWLGLAFYTLEGRLNSRRTAAIG